MTEFLELLTDPEKIIQYGGLALLLIIVFAETGLFFGFFLPGDYLLFTAGLLCGTDVFHVGIEALTISLAAAAIAGNFTGYWTGKKFGKKLFRKENSFFFKKSYLEKAGRYLEKYGIVALVLGRYFPIIRTFAPIVAGATDMPFRKFSLANISGGMIWVLSLVPLGYYVGVNHPEAMEYLSYIIGGLFLVTLMPLLKAAWSRKKINGVA